MNTPVPTLSDEISDKIVYGWLKTVSAKNNRRTREFEKLKLQYDNDLEAIDQSHPYIRRQNQYDRRSLEAISKKAKNRILAALLEEVFDATEDLSNSVLLCQTINTQLTTYGIQLSKIEKQELFTTITQLVTIRIGSQLVNILNLPSTFSYFQNKPMTLITSYIDMFETLSQQDDTTRALLSKRIADIDISLTIPYKSKFKVAQMLQGLYSEHMITFSCPDYRYYIDSVGNTVCDTCVVGSDIGSFGEIVIRSLKKTLRDIYDLGKLKTLTIIMPTYQIYLSPDEDYDVYCQKLQSTGDKIKAELDRFCTEQGIRIQIEVNLSTQLYSDALIYQRKEVVKDEVERDAKGFGDFYKKTLEIETNYGNDKFLDILVSDMAEGDLLTECFDPTTTFYFLPEDESMLRPQLVYMIQNKYSQEKCRGLPTLILQSAK